MQEFATTEDKALLVQIPKLNGTLKTGTQLIEKPANYIEPKGDETKKIYKQIYTLYVLHDFTRQEIARKLSVAVSTITRAIQYVVNQQDAMTERELQTLTVDRIRFRKQQILRKMKGIAVDEQGLWLKFQKELRMLDMYESKIDGSLKGDVQVDNSKKIVILQNIRRGKVIEVDA